MRQVALLAFLALSLAGGRRAAHDRLSADARQPACFDAVGHAARHGGRPEARLDDRLPATLAQEPPLLAPGRRALAGLARAARSLRSQTRGRPDDARRSVR